jgi:hypothetical protein
MHVDPWQGMRGLWQGMRADPWQGMRRAGFWRVMSACVERIVCRERARDACP